MPLKMRKRTEKSFLWPSENERLKPFAGIRIVEEDWWVEIVHGGG
jgi:hypothetical protein